MTVRLRPVLSSLPAYVPGRSVPDAIKLSSNETPLPPLPSVLDRIAASAATVNRYPDMFAVGLTEAIAARHGVGADRVVVGCGSVSVCTQLVAAAADAGEEVVYAWRSFEAYPIIAAVAGAASVQVPLTGFEHDLDAMAAAFSDRTRVALLCSPNNPTGTTVTSEQVERFLGAVPDDVLVVLDEAYHEFVTDADVVDGTTLLDRHPNLVVLRTFSKAYGLAGLRVGYGLCADPAVATAARQTQVPFAVTQLGQDAALASLEPAAEGELLDRVKDIVAERERVTGALRDLGYTVPDSQANFVWLPLAASTADWAAHCAQQGVIVRGFPNAGARVTIGTADENDRLLAAARSAPRVS